MSLGGEEKRFCEYIILMSELSSSFNLVLFPILCGFRIFLESMKNVPHNVEKCIIFSVIIYFFELRQLLTHKKQAEHSKS